MEVQIITPDTTLFDGNAKMVVVPGVDGLIGILDNHAPLVSALKKGKVKVKTSEKEETFDIEGGVAEVSNNKIIVLSS